MRGLFSCIPAYGKRIAKAVALYLLCAGIFAIVFAVYAISLDPVLYALLLSAVAAFLFLMIDFSFFSRRHRKLADLFETVVYNLEMMDAPADLIEADYQTLVENLLRQQAKTVSEAELRQSNMLDYYTLWVHQIKTPIAAMRLLLQHEDSKENRALTFELFKIEQYVDMALQYLRLESISQDLDLKRQPLAPIIRQSVKKFAPVFIDRRITLDMQEISMEAVTDEKWLCFVIEQILSNSLKYTKSGKIHIYQDPEKQDTLVIEDTGIGILPEDLPRVFERGFTGYNGRKDKMATGLGLYLCRRIMTTLSHKISLDSDGKTGTRAFLTFDTQGTPETLHK
jgi:signal transduction histidine kinase